MKKLLSLLTVIFMLGMSQLSYGQATPQSNITVPGPQVEYGGDLQGIAVDPGMIGEYITSTVAVASTASVTTNTPLNITSVTLTNGVWEVGGAADFVTTSTTSITGLIAGTNTVSATIGGQDTATHLSTAANVFTATTTTVPVPVQRYYVPAGTTKVVYLNVNAYFTASTLTAYGSMWALRIP